MKSVLSTLFLLALSPARASYSCLNEDGEAVDWWMVLKAPGGSDYYYLDADAPGEFKHSKHTMEKETGAVIDTVKQLYDADEGSDGWAVYNDDTDEGHQLDSHAHAKGVLVFDKAQGFWMVHSLPKWPARRSTGYNGLPTDKFGQSYLCMTLPTEQFNAVGHQLETNWVQRYDNNLPDSFAKAVPDFAKFLNGKEGADPTSLKTITTLGGVEFTSFAKTRKWGKELYGDWVSEELESGLVVETWQNGKGAMDSDCTQEYPVKNLEETKMQDGGASWTIHQDHSKWAVSTTKNKYYACIGDINRQDSQSHRGGGTVCLHNKDVWSAFDTGVVGKVEPCPAARSDLYSAVERRLRAKINLKRAH